MRPRTVLALLLLAALCAAAAIAAGGLQREAARAVVSGERVLPELRAELDRVVRVIVETEGGGYVLARDGDGWVAASAHDYPVEAERVNHLLVGLANLEKIEPKTADPARFKRLSVGDPDDDSQARLVRLESADGTLLAELIVGRQRHVLTGRADSGTYVRRPGGDRAWLAAGLADLSDGIYPWLDTLVVDVAPGTIRRIEVNRVDGGRLVAVRPERDAPALAVADVPKGAQLEVAKVRRLGALLSKVKFDRVVPADGFEPDQRLAHTVVRTFDGVQVEIDVMRRDGRYWLTVSAGVDTQAEGDEGAAERAAALSGRVEGWAYQVADYIAERLIQTRDDVLAANG